MAFLDNSGDIILDAVLTDTGRMRLARGDGTFRIAKFALGDEEIDYGTYNKTHASGSAYYDLQILQTPILEAFTNNTSTMKTKLMSIGTNLLHLPVIKLNTTHADTKMHSTNVFLVSTNATTATVLNVGDGPDGVLNGYQPNPSTFHIRLEQGMDTEDAGSPRSSISIGDLYETQYIIEMDNRFGSIVNKSGADPASLSFIDDDNIASYFLSSATGYVEAAPVATEAGDTTVLAGPKGSMLRFKIKSSLELESSNFLFTRLGSSGLTIASAAGTYRYVDTIIRITGATTGYRVDVPVRYVKKQ